MQIFVIILLAIGMPAISSAAVIRITIEYSSFPVVFNGVSQSSGPVRVDITTDTNNPDFYLSDSNEGVFEADFRVTAPVLGLNGELVVSPSYLYVNSNGQIGMYDAQVWAAQTASWAGYFGAIPMSDPNDLATLSLPFGPVVYDVLNFDTSSFSGGASIRFEGGSFFDQGQIYSGVSSSTVSGIAVPEPTVLLMLSATICLFVMFRRRSAEQVETQQPLSAALFTCTTVIPTSTP